MAKRRGKRRKKKKYVVTYPEDAVVMPVNYEYKDENKNFNLVYLPEKQISTITDEIRQPDGSLNFEVVKWGMLTKEEICEYFPPAPAQFSKGEEYNMRGLIRSIIFEAHEKEGRDIQPNNVRWFWYSHIQYLIENVLGLGESDSVKTTINNAWGDLINAGVMTYEGMNIESASMIHSFGMVKDSPFSNLFVGVEKKDFFKDLEWVPKLIRCILITAGGEPSRGVARGYVRQLRDYGVDLDQQFYICIASDCDPAGYYIQQTFVDQLEKAIEYYGGDGKIEIRRLFIRKDQVSPELLQAKAVPCEDTKAKKPSAKKAEDTKWERFCGQTDGGLYKRVIRNGAEVEVRAKLELSAFRKETINRTIVDELIEIIQDTNDESLIMIPEIMRIFELQRKEVINELYEHFRDSLIQPLIDDFLSETEGVERDLEAFSDDEESICEETYADDAAPINEEFDDKVEKLEKTKRKQFPKEYERLDRLIRLHRMIHDILKSVKTEIEEKTAHIQAEIDIVEEERKDELKPHEDARDECLKKVEKRRNFRNEQLEKFKREKATLFNPLEMALEANIAETLNDDNIPFWFKDLEDNEETREHIAKLLSNPEALLETETPCREQDFPVFTEDDLIRKASAVQDENVEAHRKGFTSDFLEAMRDMVRERSEDLTFEIGTPPELEDISQQLMDLKESIEDDVDDLEDEGD